MEMRSYVSAVAQGLRKVASFGHRDASTKASLPPFWINRYQAFSILRRLILTTVLHRS
jgi:hypothetical protein